MINKILEFIKTQLEEHRRYKLELRKCPSCENYAELLRLKQFECDRLVDKINQIPETQTVSYNTAEFTEREPISFIPSRTKAARTMHESFKRVQKLKQEFEEEKKLQTENPEAIVVND